MKLKPFVLVVQLFFFSLTMPLRADSPDIEQTKIRAEQIPTQDKYLTADKVISSKEITALMSSGKVIKRSAELIALLQRSGINTIEPEKLRRVIAFIKAAKHQVNTLLSKEADIYIHPSSEGVFTPVQFYRNGHIYIHLKRFDPQWKKGGFKNFSRTIDYRKQKLLANLVMIIDNKHDVQSYFSELRKMHRLRDEPNLIHFRDMSTYVGFSEQQLKQKVAFQSDLYAGDLAHLYSDITYGKELVKTALSATQALLDFHRYRYYHRDIKPGNHFIRRDGSSTSLVLGDFGLSQHPDDNNFCRNVGGTRGYIAPELCRSSFELGRPCSNWEDVVAADTFSLGMTMLTTLGGKDNQFKQQITVLNELVMPRKNTPPPRNITVPEQLGKIEALYIQMLQEDVQKQMGSDRYRQEVYKLLRSAVNPAPEHRITLPALKAALTTLLNS